MDYFAVVSFGVYPTPTPTTTQRAAFAVSYGLLSVVAAASAIADMVRGKLRCGLGLTLR